MQRKNHLRLILGIILIGSLAVLLIGYFALRKPAAENPSMPAPSISSSSASPSATELPTGLAKADSTNQPTAPVTSPKGASSNQTASAPAEENGITPVTVKIDSQKWYLTLVSIKYRLPDNYQPELTYPVKGIDRPLDARVTPHYVEMYNAAKADGCTLTPYSGWRSISRQKSNYENKVSTYMKEGHSRSRAELLAAEGSSRPARASTIWALRWILSTRRKALKTQKNLNGYKRMPLTMASSSATPRIRYLSQKWPMSLGTGGMSA